jgi:hypothetical protein
MKAMGFETILSDSHYNDNAILRSTPTIVHHKPDCIGYRKIDDSVCLGEAKYSGDFNNDRTIRQVCDFVTLANTKSNVWLVFGVVDVDEQKLKKIIDNNQLIVSERVEVITVPERLLPNEKQEL